MECPTCKEQTKQIKAGNNTSGSQRWRCKHCQKNYTPQPNPLGYSQELKTMAFRMYVEGNSLRGIGRILKIHHQTVANWIEESATQLPPGPFPDPIEIGELDELYTFTGDKKTDISS